MVEIKVGNGFGAKIEVEGDADTVLNDCLNIVGHLSNQIERLFGAKKAGAFVGRIPYAIYEFHEAMKSGEYEANNHEHVEEEQHEDDTVRDQ